jgi:acetolactate synthase, small subunit
MRHIIAMLLQNEAGALARVAGMFSARGYNIESLCVAPTQDPLMSRLTLVTIGSESVVDQIIKQSRKLVDVIEVVDLSDRAYLETELVIVKLRVSPDSAARVIDVVRHRHGLVLDETMSTRTVQIAGTGAEVNAFLDEIGQIAEILEVVRSGSAAIESGENCLFTPYGELT